MTGDGRPKTGGLIFWFNPVNAKCPKTGGFIFFSPFSIRINIRQYESLCYQLRNPRGQTLQYPCRAQGVLREAGSAMSYHLSPIPCPEGLNSFSIKANGWKGANNKPVKFQCPEGLNSFSILNLGYLEELNAMGFNAPKG